MDLLSIFFKKQSHICASPNFQSQNRATHHPLISFLNRIYYMAIAPCNITYRRKYIFVAIYHYYAKRLISPISNLSLELNFLLISSILNSDSINTLSIVLKHFSPVNCPIISNSNSSI